MKFFYLIHVADPSDSCPIDQPDDSRVTLLAHENCSMFYKCDRGEAIPKNCPQGLHFNPRLFVCDWPASAKCQS